MFHKADLTLRLVSVTVLTGVGEAEAVFSGIMVLVSICLFIGAQTVSETLQVIVNSVTLPHEGTYIGTTL